MVTHEIEHFYCDDISSIESSSRRERKYSEEQMSGKDEVIKSLTYAVQRLADTLETKEEELQTKDTELQTKDAELHQIKDRVDVDLELETKNLDLMIEVAELKNQVIDLTSQHGTDTSTLPTTDDSSSFQYDSVEQQYHHYEKENGENMATASSFISPRPTTKYHRAQSIARRSSGLSLSKLIPKKLPIFNSCSFLPNLGRKRRGGLFPKMNPRQIEGAPTPETIHSSCLRSA